MTELTDRDRGILDLAGAFYRHPSARLAAAQDRLDLSPTRYAAELNRLVDRPEASLYAPVVVARLRRIRDSRLRAKTPRSRGL